MWSTFYCTIAVNRREEFTVRKKKDKDLHKKTNDAFRCSSKCFFFKLHCNLNFVRKITFIIHTNASISSDTLPRAALNCQTEIELEIVGLQWKKIMIIQFPTSDNSPARMTRALASLEREMSSKKVGSIYFSISFTESCTRSYKGKCQNTNYEANSNLPLFRTRVIFSRFEIAFENREWKL